MRKYKYNKYEGYTYISTWNMMYFLTFVVNSKMSKITHFETQIELRYIHI